MKIFFVFVLITSSILSQDDSIIELFPGTWKMISDKIEYYEEWRLINVSELIGIGFSIEEGDTVLSEELYVKKFADKWAYVALPVNQTITLFALTEYSENKFIFENEEHDYPQKIIYEFTADGKLNAATEGIIEGELMRRDFSFIRINK
ncbi:MAG: DUF6265 family protein [Ignavibacteriaceae bacterium]|jgi:hypothetical protein|nr:DUF6265 family protein [Ignavibacteriaceae bacterium]